MDKYEITVNGETFVIEVGDASTSPTEVIVNGVQKTVEFSAVDAEPAAPTAPAPSATRPAPEAPVEEPEAPEAPTPVGAVTGATVSAPMPGKILSIVVSTGDQVVEGETICTLEAMKMEMPVSSTASGTVQAIHVQVGSSVANNEPLITVG